MSPALRWSLLFGLLISNGGCFELVAALSWRRKDVTNRLAFQGGYSAGQVVEATADLFLMTTRDSTRGYMVAPASSLGRPRGDEIIYGSLEDYRRDPQYWREVKAALPAGTRFRLKQLVYVRGFNHNFVHPIALVLDGPETGSVVDLTGVSQSVDAAARADEPFPPYLFEPDPQYLKPVSDEKGSRHDG